ncbi:YbaB/EbfC family nucleoid-associated protein [Actinoallomurus rhizosphaericola]|uniref:YbaB/EbfC family nucleoid-associated protein n=1 Tax=Actinoallomurus rhizosphaericola TaxID=2952536 RepID=UPI00209307A9|nr:YbaB/EbfC family nucleoid-associated protein [Actinoallomurus rhizosphaericola]MCO6000260.1 YbaB/EbfC family nucleoid-associated protein [Actinoallomurus rhizosphaericola]
MPETPQNHFEALARRAEQMNYEVADVQAAMQSMEATGYGGDGLVRATVSGQGRLVGLDIDRSVIDPDDRERLSALVMEAVNDAAEALSAQRAERMNEVTGNLADIIDQLQQTPTRYSGNVVPKVPNRRPGSPPSRLPRLPGLNDTR